MRLPKQAPSVERKLVGGGGGGAQGDVTPSGDVCSAFPETCGLGL